ncbi:MAG: copper chaperone PCu(A)C [Burkholderiales bacterium]
MMKRCLCALSAMLALNAAMADDYHAGNLHITHAHTRATVPGQASGAAYLTIDNRGTADDKLLSVASPAAQSAQVHSMVMDGDMMRMREVPALELKSSAHVEMQPGNGYHIMLIGLKQALKPGEKIPLSLHFEKAGKLEIEVVVDEK